MFANSRNLECFIMFCFFHLQKGDASKRPDNMQIKIYHWNLTNKDEFLYSGALPKVWKYLLALELFNFFVTTDTLISDKCFV